MKVKFIYGTRFALINYKYKKKLKLIGRKSVREIAKQYNEQSMLRLRKQPINC